MKQKILYENKIGSFCLQKNLRHAWGGKKKHGAKAHIIETNTLAKISCLLLSIEQSL